MLISPYSVSLAIAMAYNGANSETKTAIETALRLNGLTRDEININFKQISEALLKVDERVILSLANSIWYRNDFYVIPEFINVNRDFYNAEVNSLDFNSPVAKDIINDWVSEYTKGKITEIVDQINSETVMFLINATYFKGPWKFLFDKEDNFYSTFYLTDGTTKQVEMMTQSCELAHFSNSSFSMIELPYGQGNWAMDLILPNSGKTLNDIIVELSGDSWNLWIGSLESPGEIQLTLPPFKFDYSKTLNDILSGMGMSIAFDPYQADFSGINDSVGLYLTKVKHKTCIEVNEEGTEAVAVTSVEVGITSMGPSLVFDKPFLFVIREVTTGTILFIGKLENPIR
jgi:serpin B